MPVEISQGLSESAAKELLASHGYNELPQAQKKSFLILIFETVREPMILLLLAGAGVYFAIGEPHDSLLLLASVLVIISIALFQERRSTRALEALRDLSSPKALVRRGGHEIRISSREVVPGDILIFKEGDRIVADGRLCETRNLEVDESLLTGESQPVSKKTPLGESSIHFPSQYYTYSGTLVTAGFGVSEVSATGIHSELGKIGKSLGEMKETKTRLQQEVAVLVRKFSLLGLAVSISIVVAYGLTRGEWSQGFLAGIAAALSLLPEEFPVILTIFLALGAWRLSKRQVLVREPSATENFGAITALCVDKTGTLTLNQMTVYQIRTLFSSVYLTANGESLSEDILAVLEAGCLSSHADSFDPMERALHNVHTLAPGDGRFSKNHWQLEKQYPFSHQQLTMSFVWKSVETSERFVACKGAPEAILKLCILSDTQRQKLEQTIQEMCQEGLRVIGVAKADFAGKDLPGSQDQFEFSFLGFIGFLDPVRKGVKEAIAECYGAGVRTLMVTGDHPVIASKIAEDIGLRWAQTSITGAELEKISDQELREKIKTVSVFARVVPAQKLRIVNALKANGEIVAMTGDGVNDAPSLKWADVGIAMGGRGTDVAREAADLIILDDNFTSLVPGIRLGRRIFGNIHRAMCYLFAVHFPIAALAIGPILLGYPLVLYPAHIVFLELVIDPACTMVFEAEPEEPQSMRRPPRRLDKPLFSYKDIILSSAQGVAVFLGVFALFLWCLSEGFHEEKSRALAFTAFALSNVGLIFVNKVSKTFFSNIYFAIVSVSAVALLAAIVFTSGLAHAFKIEAMTVNEFAASLAVSLVCVLAAYGIRKFHDKRDL